MADQVTTENLMAYAGSYCTYIDDVEMAKYDLINKLSTLAGASDFKD